MPTKPDNIGNLQKSNTPVDTKTQEISKQKKKANSLGKIGAEQLLTGAVSTDSAKKAIRNNFQVWMRQKHIRRWMELAAHRHSKLLLVHFSKEIAKEVAKTPQKAIEDDDWAGKPVTVAFA